MYHNPADVAATAGIIMAAHITIIPAAGIIKHIMLA